MLETDHTFIDSDHLAQRRRPPGRSRRSHRSTGGHSIYYWGEAAARINDGRADELERGGDRG